MSTLNAIAYNCRKATFLIEKQNLSGITIKQQYELKFHLAGCSVCQLFQQQSLLIDKMVKKHFFTEEEDLPKLDNNFKQNLEKRIESELNQK
ncbi:hypothetical protein [Daejeonella sp.]|uniref:hypothetical protein n=1 Tax=Daejeonella sp. TaxID=2805397 RepID=UPI002722ED72|nr:hypothetical protein [Daejeonella sp.]MDO8993803.1 hypothetical protein [Daejeonella sp.]MDP2415642.1 hypothetical protein [Daejeonella sp.]